MRCEIGLRGGGPARGGDAGQRLQERVGETTLERARAFGFADAARPGGAEPTGRGFGRGPRPKPVGEFHSRAPLSAAPPSSSAVRPSPKRRIVSPSPQRRGDPAHRFLKAETNEVVPASVRAALRVLVACDDQSLRRAGHRNIQKAPVFAGLGFAPFRPRPSDGFAVLRRLSAPGEERRIVRLGGSKPQKLRVVTPVGRPAGVGQKDDRGFEPLACVDREHADAVAFGLHVALDRRVGRPRPRPGTGSATALRSARGRAPGREIRRSGPPRRARAAKAAPSVPRPRREAGRRRRRASASSPARARSRAAAPPPARVRRLRRRARRRAVLFGSPRG